MKKLPSTIFLLFTFFVLQAGETWLEKAKFFGPGRNKSVYFSIGEKGYIGSGDISQKATQLMGKPTNDFWEYDAANDKWTQKANMPKAHYDGFCFAAGGKGYVGVGYIDKSSISKKDDAPTEFWEYDPATNKWNKKSDFPRYPGSYGFAIGNKGYVLTFGHSFTKKEEYGVWEYDPSADFWARKSGIDIKGSNMFYFVIDSTVYFGGDKTIYAYDIKSGKWSQKLKYKTGTCEAGWVYFTHNGKGYFGGGGCPNGTISKSMYEFDPVKNTVTKKGELFSGIEGAIAFPIGNRIFGGLGITTMERKSQHWYEYKPE